MVDGTGEKYLEMHMMAARRLVFLSFLFLVVAAVPAAANYEQGLRAFNAAAYGQAEEIWRPLAEAGDVRAQYALGVLFETKAAGNEDLLERAARWYGRAAAEGHAGAQTNLGSLYAQGFGVARDRAKAVELWLLAAEQGHVLASYNLGLAYYRGSGVLADVSQSRAWFERAAEAGLADAQFAMGQIYLLGVGGPKDAVRAKVWLELAQEQGHKGAAEELQRLRESPGVLAQDEAQVVAESVPVPEPEPEPVPQAAEASVPSEEEVAEQEEPIDPSPSDEPVGANQEATMTAEETPTIAVAVPEDSGEPDDSSELEESGGKVEASPSAADAAAPAAASEETAGPRSNGHVVWLGTFKKRSEAEDFRNKTLSRYGPLFSGYPISIVPLGGGTGHRVFAQGVLGKAEAERFCASLMDGIDNAFCAVMKL